MAHPDHIGTIPKCQDRFSDTGTIATIHTASMPLLHVLRTSRISRSVRQKSRFLMITHLRSVPTEESLLKTMSLSHIFYLRFTVLPMARILTFWRRILHIPRSTQVRQPSTARCRCLSTTSTQRCVSPYIASLPG